MAELLRPEDIAVRRACLERRADEVGQIIREEARLRESKSIEVESQYLATIDARDARIEALEAVLRDAKPYLGSRQFPVRVEGQTFEAYAKAAPLEDAIVARIDALLTPR